MGFSIVVEGGDVFAVGSTNAGVHPRCKSHVLRQRHDFDFGKIAPQEIDGTVGGTIVHDDGPEILETLGPERPQTRPQPFQAIPVRDDHRYPVRHVQVAPG